jgi:hypothetical protein
LIVVDSVPNDEYAFELKCLEMRNGKLLSRFKQPLQSKLEWAGRFMTVESISPKSRDGRLCIKTSLPKGKETWFVLQVEDETGNLSETSRFQVSPNVLTKDVDGDGILDIVAIDGKHVEVRRGDNNELLSSFDVPERFNDRGIEMADGKAYLVGAISQNLGHQWIELPYGAIAINSTHGFQGMTQPATPCLIRHSTGAMLVGQTPEYPMCAEVDFGQAVPKAPPPIVRAAFLEPSTDMRYRKPIQSVGLYQGRKVGEITTLGMTAICVILLPGFYLLQLLRDRQWSLRKLLFGPIVVMVAMLACRSPWLYAPPGLTLNLILGVTSALSLLAIVFLVLYQHWRILAIGIAMSLLMGGFTMLLSLMIRDQNDYWTVSSWLEASFAAGFQLIVPFAAGPWWMKYMQKQRLP